LDAFHVSHDTHSQTAARISKPTASLNIPLLGNPDMAYPTDPVNPIPGSPLIHGYSYHSALPDSAAVSVTDAEGAKVQWMMGIDEAGRGREYLSLSDLVTF
jgi:hypothetical protein